jgi:cell filamentation protein
VTDPYLQANNVLKNLLGITEATHLSQAEADFTRLRIAELFQGFGPAPTFDLAHLKAIHHYVFQDVYEWAGKTRGERTTIQGQTFMPPPLLQKGDNLFALGPNISAFLEPCFRDIKARDFFKGLTIQDFVTHSADALADLNSAHPFREGNGRTQRLFIEMLARQAGYTFDFSSIPQKRMITVSIAAHNGDVTPLRMMLLEICAMF